MGVHWHIIESIEGGFFRKSISGFLGVNYRDKRRQWVEFWVF